MGFLQGAVWLIPTWSLKRYGGFVPCFETGDLINWYWISGVQADGGGPGHLERQCRGILGDSPSDWGFAFVRACY